MWFPYTDSIIVPMTTLDFEENEVINSSVDSKTIKDNNTPLKFYANIYFQTETFEPLRVKIVDNAATLQ